MYVFTREARGKYIFLSFLLIFFFCERWRFFYCFYFIFVGVV